MKPFKIIALLVILTSLACNAVLKPLANASPNPSVTPTPTTTANITPIPSPSPTASKAAPKPVPTKGPLTIQGNNFEIVFEDDLPAKATTVSGEMVTCLLNSGETFATVLGKSSQAEKPLTCVNYRNGKWQFTILEKSSGLITATRGNGGTIAITVESIYTNDTWTITKWRNISATEGDKVQTGVPEKYQRWAKITIFLISEKRVFIPPSNGRFTDSGKVIFK